jgi:hypothetical protein
LEMYTTPLSLVLTVHGRPAIVWCVKSGIPARSEHSEQVSVITWSNPMSREFPALRLLHAIPKYVSVKYFYGSAQAVPGRAGFRRTAFFGYTRGLRDDELSKLLGWPAYRVYQVQIIPVIGRKRATIFRPPTAIRFEYLDSGTDCPGE